MKHLIIGSGVIGKATGTLLEAHKQDVSYNDIELDVMSKLGSEGKKVEMHINRDYDLYWICTAEWNISDVLKRIKDKDAKIVIRSTIKPYDITLYKNKYHFEHIAHIPEFLREKTAIADIFNADRMVIGTTDFVMQMILTKVLMDCDTPKIFCTPQESALIKLTANAWLAMQISFWNEIKKLSDTYDDINPQLIANGTTLDHRISRYGSNMIGKPFGQFCFPKDTKSLAKVFKDKNMKSRMIDALIKVNEEMK